jgi:hypothetical protein
MCVCVRAYVCVRVCVRACVHACVRARDCIERPREHTSAAARAPLPAAAAAAAAEGTLLPDLRVPQYSAPGQSKWGHVFDSERRRRKRLTEEEEEEEV